MTDTTLFIGVGAAKAGTSWLAERMRRHPEIAMPLKELHWFDQRAHRQRFEADLARQGNAWLDRRASGEQLKPRGRAVLLRLSMRNDDDYRRYFDAVSGPRHRAFGEFTPSYSILGPSQFRRMTAIHPRTRFVFLMRNPVDRMWSQYRFGRRRRGLEAPASYDPSALSENATVALRRRGDYAATLRKVWEAAPREHVFTCFYEDMFDVEQRTQLLDDLWTFLSVDRITTSDEQFEQRVNATPGSAVSAEDRTRMARECADVYEWALAEFDRVPDVWRRDAVLAT